MTEIGHELFEASFWLSAKNPVLRPFATVYISLRVVVPNGLLFRHVVLVVGHASALRGRQIWAHRPWPGLHNWRRRGRRRGGRFRGRYDREAEERIRW